MPVTDEEYAAGVLERILCGHSAQVLSEKGHEPSHDIDLRDPGGAIKARVEVVRLTDPDTEKGVKKGVNPSGFFDPASNVAGDVNERVKKKARKDQAGAYGEPKWLMVVLSSPGGFYWINTLNERPPGLLGAGSDDADEAVLGQLDGICCEHFAEVWIVWEQFDMVRGGQETAVASFPARSLRRMPGRWWEG